MKTIDCSRQNPITADELMRSYHELGIDSYLPVDKSVATKFLSENKLIAVCPDIKYVTEIFKDYVGSTGSYEEGTEECW